MDRSCCYHQLFIPLRQKRKEWPHLRCYDICNPYQYYILQKCFLHSVWICFWWKLPSWILFLSCVWPLWKQDWPKSVVLFSNCCIRSLWYSVWLPNLHPRQQTLHRFIILNMVRLIQVSYNSTCTFKNMFSGWLRVRLRQHQHLPSLAYFFHCFRIGQHLLFHYQKLFLDWAMLWVRNLQILTSYKAWLVEELT